MLMPEMDGMVSSVLSLSAHVNAWVQIYAYAHAKAHVTWQPPTSFPRQEADMAPNITPMPSAKFTLM